MALEIKVIYEDQRGPRQGFTLHTFLCACVVDKRLVAAREFWAELKAIKARVKDHPVKGNGNVKALCRTLQRQARASHVVAVLDRDKLFKLVKLKASACRGALVDGFLSDCGASGQDLCVVLLEENIESLLHAARDLGIVVGGEIDRAIDKEVVSRDSVFGKLSLPGWESQRAQIIERVPSWGRLRDAVLRLLA